MVRFMPHIISKEDEVAFLRGYVAQLTQNISQLSIKPGEEDKEKGLVEVLEEGLKWTGTLFSF